jgi:hypothetical protein
MMEYYLNVLKMINEELNHAEHKETVACLNRIIIEIEKDIKNYALDNAQQYKED